MRVRHVFKRSNVITLTLVCFHITLLTFACPADYFQNAVETLQFAADLAPDCGGIHAPVAWMPLSPVPGHHEDRIRMPNYRLRL